MRIAVGAKRTKYESHLSMASSSKALVSTRGVMSAICGHRNEPMGGSARVQGREALCTAWLQLILVLKRVAQNGESQLPRKSDRRGDVSAQDLSRPAPLPRETWRQPPRPTRKACIATRSRPREHASRRDPARENLIPKHE